MTIEIAIVLAILVAAIVMFVTERIRVDVVALMVLVSLALTGLITHVEPRQNVAVINAEVPLAEMFGYSTDIRSATQGKGTFTMEFHCYRQVPREIQEEIILARKKAAAEQR